MLAYGNPGLQIVGALLAGEDTVALGGHVLHPPTVGAILKTWIHN